MNGTRSRRGFAFQDLVLARRIVGYLVRRRRQVIEGQTPSAEPTFGTEVSPTLQGGPDWDNLQITDDGGTVLEEVKSGEIKAEDRRALWLRIRRSLIVRQPGVRVRLTVNEEKLPSQDVYYEKLGDAVRSCDGAIPPSSVGSPETMAQEALHYLGIHPPNRI